MSQYRICLLLNCVHDDNTINLISLKSLLCSHRLFRWKTLHCTIVVAIVILCVLGKDRNYSSLTFFLIKFLCSVDFNDI